MKKLKPTKEYLNNTINSLKKKMVSIQFENRVLLSEIKQQKKSILPNTSISHEQLWDMRRLLKLNQKYIHLIKLEILELKKQMNDLYNEHNINNVSKHGIKKRFLSCKNPKSIMYRMNWYCDVDKTFAQNCNNFVDWVEKQGELDKLKEILYGKSI